MGFFASALASFHTHAFKYATVRMLLMAPVTW